MSNSIGNLKNSGLQGNNFPWQLKMLQGLQGIINALNNNGEDIETAYVVEKCPGPPPTERVLLEVRIWDTVTNTWGTIEYYIPGSNTPVAGPVPAAGCTLEYVDASNIRPLTCVDQITLCNSGNPVDSGNPLPNALYDLSGNAITSTFIPSSSQYALDVNVAGPIGQQSINSSVATALGNEQANVQVIPMVIEINGSIGDLMSYIGAGNQVLSISFASRGTDPVNLSVDGNSTGFILYPGETLNMDANGVMNYYDPTLFYWDASALGAKLLIALNYI